MIQIRGRGIILTHLWNWLLKVWLRSCDDGYLELWWRCLIFIEWCLFVLLRIKNIHNKTMPWKIRKRHLAQLINLGRVAPYRWLRSLSSDLIQSWLIHLWWKGHHCPTWWNICPYLTNFIWFFSQFTLASYSWFMSLLSVARRRHCLRNHGLHLYDPKIDSHVFIWHHSQGSLIPKLVNHRR